MCNMQNAKYVQYKKYDEYDEYDKYAWYDEYVKYTKYANPFCIWTPPLEYEPPCFNITNMSNMQINMQNMNPPPICICKKI